MLKQTELHGKQNSRSWAVISLNWSYIYWTHTFPKSSWSLNRKLCHVVARTIIKIFVKPWKMLFLLTSNCNQQLNWYVITRTKLIVLLLGERKRNLLRAVASANTSTTIDMKQLVQLNTCFSLVLFIIWVENFTYNLKLLAEAAAQTCS